MKYRKLGKTGFEVSEISLGTWQLGGGWGKPFDEEEAYRTLNLAIDEGINFLDTADVYSGGLSEKAVGKIIRERKEDIVLATKAGRRLNPHAPEGYTPANIEGFIDDSLKNTGCDSLDLVQLHCPPTDVYYKPELFDALDRMREAGKIRHYGVSVERVEEALKAIEYPGVETVQIIFNMFRQRPAELFFSQAAIKDVGIIVRVPLASGLLTGKFSRDTRFEKQDHRTFNRNGEAFDKGETFAGIPYEKGLDAVEELREIFPGEELLVMPALKWILMHEQVSCIIPGASRSSQVTSNVQASGYPDLTGEQMERVRDVYDRAIGPYVHHLW
ncbi:MAG: aldo/keto reductase [Spirochaetales bacterium]|nr:aldo/keto reductase [Spirochaetales bacterium]